MKFLFAFTLFASVALADQPSFKRVVIVVLENESVDKALKQPFLASLARAGASLSNYNGVARPSQPNYLAMTSGNHWRRYTDMNVNLDVRHIGDLLEEKGMSWKNYAEGFPGDCYTGKKQGKYVRKHVPFLSYTNVTSNTQRCVDHVVSAERFDADIQAGTLPEYSMYTPDMDNDGHDTGVEFADRWLEKRFGPLIKNRSFMKDTLLVVTFDEGSLTTNRIYAVFYGDMVTAGARSDQRYDHYSLLRTIEDAYGLGTLGEKDEKASPITGIWK